MKLLGERETVKISGIPMQDVPIEVFIAMKTNTPCKVEGNWHQRSNVFSGLWYFHEMQLDQVKGSIQSMTAVRHNPDLDEAWDVENAEQMSSQFPNLYLRMLRAGAIPIKAVAKVPMPLGGLVTDAIKGLPGLGVATEPQGANLRAAQEAILYLVHGGKAVGLSNMLNTVTDHRPLSRAEFVEMCSPEWVVRQQRDEFERLMLAEIDKVYPASVGAS